MNKSEAITAVIDKATGRARCDKRKLAEAVAVLEPVATPKPAKKAPKAGSEK